LHSNIILPMQLNITFFVVSSVWICGSDYEVRTKKKIMFYEDHKLYLYTIRHRNNNHKWYIVSVLKELRFTENSLAIGMFLADHEINESDDFDTSNIELTLYDISLEEIF